MLNHLLENFLDPIADKILLCSSILTIILITNDYFIGLMGLIILIREFWVSGLREYTAITILNKASDVSFLAKIKTTTSVYCYWFLFIFI